MARYTSPRDTYVPDLGDLRGNTHYDRYLHLADEAVSYRNSLEGRFELRNRFIDEVERLRFGLERPTIPKKHAKDVAPGTVATKQYNEIADRVGALLDAKYPTWTFEPDSPAREAALRAATLSGFAESLWRTIQELAREPTQRMFVDEQIWAGTAYFKVDTRFDRYANIPDPLAHESQRAYDRRLLAFLASRPPFEISVPSTKFLYPTHTSDGLERMLETRMVSAFEAAHDVAGQYVDSELSENEGYILGELELKDELGNVKKRQRYRIAVDSSEHEVELTDYWKRGEGRLICINGEPVRWDYLDPADDIPYFVGYGKSTNALDPGYRHLPLLWNAHEDFRRKLNFIAQESANIKHHGFTRMFLYVMGGEQNSSPTSAPTKRPEQEEMGNIQEMRKGESAEFVAPPDASRIFTPAIDRADKAIEEAGMSQTLTGQVPPSGTTGWLWSQVSSAAHAVYLPFLTERALAIRNATLYMLRQLDKLEPDTKIHVPARRNDATRSSFISYRPRQSRYTSNLDIKIKAPLPSDRFQMGQFWFAAQARGLASIETTMREGLGIENPQRELERIRLDQFNQQMFRYNMLKAAQEVGQLDEIKEMALAGQIEDPILAQLAINFASGQDGNRRPQGQVGARADQLPGSNPSGVIAASPGQGQSATPTTGGAANSAGFPAGGGRVAGADRRPGGQG